MASPGNRSVRGLTMSYRIVLADDHPLIREGVRSVLSELDGIEVIGEVGDGLELLNLLHTSKPTPDMVILDIAMPKLQGIEAARQIKMTYPDIKVLILTVHREREYLQQIFSTGAEGYLLKDDTVTEIASAIEAIREGGHYTSAILFKELIDDWVK
jgi:DNA-binding NarL/FixJ family response regulator